MPFVGLTLVSCERGLMRQSPDGLYLYTDEGREEIALPPDKGRAAALAADRERAEDAKLRDLYQLAYARDPRPEELAAARAHLEKGASRSSDEKGNAVNGRRQAWEDLIWAVLNTKEFLFNH